MKLKRRMNGSMIMRALIYFAAALTVGVMLFIVAYILIKGVPNLTPELFAWEYNSKNVSMLPALINTVIVTFCTLLVAVPIGICSAVFLAEYARRGSKLVSVIRITNETLAGIPSIVYGLFGFLAVVITPGRSYSLLACALTLAIMVLPTIIRTTEEALIAVPDSYREGSFGLGAGKLRTVFRIIVPTAMPGIISGVILSVGRIVGETAALIFTAGTLAEVPNGIFSSVRTLAVHMYCLMSEGLYTEQAYATAVVLLVLAAVINWVSNFAAKKLSKR